MAAGTLSWRPVVHWVREQGDTPDYLTSCPVFHTVRGPMSPPAHTWLVCPLPLSPSVLSYRVNILYILTPPHVDALAGHPAWLLVLVHIFNKTSH